MSCQPVQLFMDLHCGKITMGVFVLFRAAKYRPGLDY